MNFLAHVLLAGAADSDQLGGILGDFVKGPLPAGLPPELAAGVALHRRIDSYAETHPAYCRSRARVGSLRRRYAGIMVDMFYDHLLAANWADYSAVPLAAANAAVYRLLRAQAHMLPPRLNDLLPHMIAEDWLGSYRTVAGIGAALERMARHRLKRPGTLPGAVTELEEGYAGFARDFVEFMRDALLFSAAERQGRTSAPELR